ncbi:MAG: SDR family oxidoreductase [Proteobacteria bacterium]|nr:SDR family oxidoreductase [Pseudomonadota bacterium]
MKLEGKVAIITASGRGIGKDVALTLAEEGASVAVNSFTEENTAAVVEEIKKKGGKSLGIAGDITQAPLIDKMVSETIKTFGQIDIVVNNAGGVGFQAGKDMSAPLAGAEAMWDGTYALSLKAPALMCEAIMPHFMERKSGKIVNMASIAGRSGMGHTEITPIPFCYHAMKAGLIRYTQLLADQLGPYSINANCVCPGIIYTDSWKGISQGIVQNHPKYKGEDPREWFLGVSGGRYLGEGAPNTPLKREQTTGDIARAVVFLVSDDAENITGQALNVDGGMVKD